MTATVSIKMGWKESAPLLLQLASDGNATGRAFALSELRRMAAAADMTASQARHGISQRRLWVVAVYEVSRAYGGPEEGGWYYSEGTQRRTLRTYATEAAADAACARANGLLNTLHSFRHWQDRTGDATRYVARSYAGAAPEFFPATRPHYE